MDTKEKNKLYMRKRRAEAKEQGIKLKSDSWFSDNPEKNRLKGQRWRDANFDRAKEIDRASQAKRRSTPWGKITNRLHTISHNGIKRKSTRYGKYNKVLCYTWNDLRKHIEKQFDENMNWDNWGEYWEIDHIKPISSYRYIDINDIEFKECWALSNIQPLTKRENTLKGNKY